MQMVSRPQKYPHCCRPRPVHLRLTSCPRTMRVWLQSCPSHYAACRPTFRICHRNIHTCAHQYILRSSFPYSKIDCIPFTGLTPKESRAAFAREETQNSRLGAGVAAASLAGDRGQHWPGGWRIAWPHCELGNGCTSQEKVESWTVVRCSLLIGM